MAGTAVSPAREKGVAIVGSQEAHTPSIVRTAKPIIDRTTTTVRWKLPNILVNQAKMDMKEESNTSNIWRKRTQRNLSFGYTPCTTTRAGRGSNIP